MQRRSFIWLQNSNRKMRFNVGDEPRPSRCLSTGLRKVKRSQTEQAQMMNGVGSIDQLRRKCLNNPNAFDSLSGF
jgi:hypothetical protein